MILSDAYEKILLDLLLVNTANTPDATLYFGLFTADPTDVGTITSEFLIGTGAYARAVVTNNTTNFPLCSAVGSPVKSNGAIIAFPTATTAWGTANYWAVFKSATLGAANMIAYGPLVSPRTVAIGDTPKFAIRAFSITPTNASTGGLTAYAKRKLLDHTFGAATYTSANPVYVGLGTALVDDTITEWADTSYARRSCAFTAAHATAGTCPNTSLVAISADVAALASVTLTHYGIWDDAVSGNLLVTGAINSSRTLAQHDTVNIAAGACVVTLQ
jgi:hypothetical protein